VQPPALTEPLSSREIEVLRLVATGATNRAIAESLFVAEGTVRNHLTNILGKLGVNDRTQAALKAKELGLV
jgi:DNA-binding NarL/FixJ family response regulator